MSKKYNFNVSWCDNGTMRNWVYTYETNSLEEAWKMIRANTDYWHVDIKYLPSIEESILL
jgi:hypothetical protein